VSNAPLGIFGGTFDPIHFGHLRLAEEAAEACALGEVRFVPAALPNLREAPRTPAMHRLAMVRLAVAGNPRLAVDGRELEREGMSYTVDTLDALRAQTGPARSLCLLLGADAFLRLPQWSRWQRLLDLAHVVVATRPGHALETRLAEADSVLGGVWRERRAGSAAELGAQPAGRVFRIDIPLLDISASGIRERLARGASVRYLLPRAVIEYIEVHRLYGGQ